jgi:hypothetical protein
MYCLYEQWHALAAWAAGQPVYLQITVGSAILTLAYVLFVLVLSSAARDSAPRQTRPADVGSSAPTLRLSRFRAFTWRSGSA